MLHPNLEVTTIDSNQTAVAVLKQNLAKFQLTNIHSILGKAPIELEDKFDGGNMAEILAWSFQLLKPDGRLVLNFILLENALRAMEWLETNHHSFQTIQMHVSQFTKLGQGHYFKPQNPVIIIETRKED